MYYFPLDIPYFPRFRHGAWLLPKHCDDWGKSTHHAGVTEYSTRAEVFCYVNYFVKNSTNDYKQADDGWVLKTVEFLASLTLFIIFSYISRNQRSQNIDVSSSQSASMKIKTLARLTRKSNVFKTQSFLLVWVAGMIPDSGGLE